MSTSPFLRHRQAILAAALTAIALSLMTVAAVNVMERLSAGFGQAYHRLLPHAPRLPGAGAWRIRSCAAR